MSKANADDMGFLDHLEMLRWHLLRSLVAIGVFAVVAFIFHDFIFDNILLAPKKGDFVTNAYLCKLGEWAGVPRLCINNLPLQIINIKMAGQFAMHIGVSFALGFILAFPVIFWEMWRFIKPALYTHEISHARGAVFYTSALFMLGVLFGYYIIAPLSVHFLGSYSVSQEVTNQINLRSYIGTITSVTLASGVTFELPVLIFFFSRIGLVTPQFLRKYRKHAIILILVLAATITPPDIFSLFLVTLPLLVLYEVGIRISSRVLKRQAQPPEKQ
ncbi:MAG: twin-arginine translocase subunit TatC [Bacteroidales bacterium]|jgi:sec-independent protein translocase protein TatC